MKLTDVVKKQVRSIALYNGGMTAILNVAFFALGHWDYTVLLGSLFGYFTSIASFIFLGISVQNAVNKTPKQAQAYMQGTYMGRMVFTVIMLIIAMKLPFFNWISAAIPLVFTSLTVVLMNFTKKEE